jgi:crotonobetainyl-CoA:carnitine CoA-transferase CaiB-like acyl-CoA transferase
MSRVLAGPYCTMILADLGADVIKIESDTGDETRRWGPPFHNGTAAYYYAINRNKRSVQMNLRSERGKRVVERLLAEADVLVHNMLPDSAARLGIGYESIKELNPTCIYCAISAFGPAEPNRKGYDLIIQALGGLMSVTGQPGGPPTKVGVPISDIAAGLFAAIGILAGLTDRARTGQGSQVEISLAGTVPSLLVNHAMNWLLCGVEPEAIGNEHPSVVPYTAFTTRDGHLAVGAATDDQFAKLCEAMDRHDLPSDVRYATNAARVANRESLTAIMVRFFATAEASEWEAKLTAVGVPAARVRKISEVLADSAATAEVVSSVLSRTGENLPQVLSPIRLNGKLLEPFQPPPDLGEHNDLAFTPKT